MIGSRKTLCLSGLAATVSTVAVVAVLAITTDPKADHPIDGIWLSRLYCGCLCDSHNFFLFKEGQIIQYSDTHETDYTAGTYEELGDGLYRVIIFSNYGSDFNWEIRPGKRSWVPPPDAGTSRAQRRAAKFYRPWGEFRDRALIASAPHRDQEIRYRNAQLNTSESRPD